MSIFEKSKKVLKTPLQKTGSYHNAVKYIFWEEKNVTELFLRFFHCIFLRYQNIAFLVTLGNAKNAIKILL